MLNKNLYTVTEFITLVDNEGGEDGPTENSESKKVTLYELSDFPVSSEIIQLASALKPGYAVEYEYEGDMTDCGRMPMITIVIDCTHDGNEEDSPSEDEARGYLDPGFKGFH